MDIYSTGVSIANELYKTKLQDLITGLDGQLPCQKNVTDSVVGTAVRAYGTTRRWMIPEVFLKNIQWP